MNRSVSHILLIDDDEATNFINRKLLARAQAADHIEVAQNGAEALALLGAIVSGQSSLPFPEIIFLDINMPIMDGWEFLDQFNRFSSTIRDRAFIICMLTTSLQEADRKKVQQYGYIASFIEKPLRLEVITKVLSQYFSKYSNTY